MRRDLTEIITTLMSSYGEEGYYDKSIIKGIRSLASNWPNLTSDERKEI